LRSVIRTNALVKKSIIAILLGVLSAVNRP
jgi:hypothetical protein